MAAPAYTYTLTNGSTADASQVQQNFTDILNGVTDGTKDLSISALTCAGTLTANGHVNLGNASADDVTFTGSLASTIPIKTTNTYNIGSSTLGLAGVYFGANSQTVRIVGSGSMSATWTLTLPVSAGSSGDLLQTNGSGVATWVSTITGLKTFSDGIELDDDADQDTLNYYREDSKASTFTFDGSGGTSASVTIQITRIGRLVHLDIPEVTATSGTGSQRLTQNTALDAWATPASTATVPVYITNNGTVQEIGFCEVTSSGLVRIQRADLAAYTNSTTCGTSGRHQITYRV